MSYLLKIFNPAFFDIFGVLFFIFLGIVSAQGLRKPVPKAIFIILLLAGIIGFILDSISVYKFYILGA